MFLLASSPNGIANASGRVSAVPAGVWITHIALLAVGRLRTAVIETLVMTCLKMQKQASLMAEEKKP